MQRINADLANDLGNLAQRSLSMIAKNCGGAVPDWREASRRLTMISRCWRRRTRLIGAARLHMQAFAAASLPRRRVRRRRQGEPLFRQQRALETRQERPRAHARRAVHDDRDAAHRRRSCCNRSCRRRWANCSIFWRVEAGRAQFRGAGRRRGCGAASKRPSACGRARRCRRRRRCFRAMSSRRRRRNNASHRQPLPSRLSRFRRRDRERRGARAGRRRRADGDDLDARRAGREARRDRRALRRRSISPSAPIRIRRPRSRRPTRRRSAPSRPIPNASAIGEAGLDYHYNYAPADIAKTVFRAQIALARELRLAARDPRPRGRRRRRRDPARGNGARRFLGGSALFHFVARARRDRPGARPLHFLFRRADVQELRASCARSRATSRSTVCSSRPTRRFSRPFPIAADATSRLSSSRRRAFWPASRKSTRPSSPPRRAPTRCGCSPKWRRTGAAALEPVADHIGLRFVRRRAARRAGLGRLRSRQSAQPPPAMFRAGRARGAGGADLGARRHRAGPAPATDRRRRRASRRRADYPRARRPHARDRRPQADRHGDAQPRRHPHERNDLEGAAPEVLLYFRNAAGKLLSADRTRKASDGGRAERRRRAGRRDRGDALRSRSRRHRRARLSRSAPSPTRRT